MSPLFENNSEEITFTGLEIQLYVPNHGQDISQDARLCQLHKVLRQMVAQSALQLKQLSPDQSKGRTGDEVIEAVPISFKVPEVCDIDIPAMGNKLRLHRTKRGTPTKLAGTVFPSFKLPEDCPFGEMELDKLQASQVVDNQVTTAKNNKAHKFLFSERLDGWKIERRQRFNGKFDMYYFHGKSRRMFRSTIEVVNFILYETYPGKRRTPNKTENSSKKESDKKEKKRKWTAPSLEDKVKRFLETAYNNLLNFFNKEEDQKPQGSTFDMKRKEEQKTSDQRKATFFESIFTSLIEDFDNSVGPSSFSSEYCVPKYYDRSLLSEEEDLINHIPEERSLESLVDFLVQNRKGE